MGRHSRLCAGLLAIAFSTLLPLAKGEEPNRPSGGPSQPGSQRATSPEVLSNADLLEELRVLRQTVEKQGQQIEQLQGELKNTRRALSQSGTDQKREQLHQAIEATLARYESATQTSGGSEVEDRLSSLESWVKQTQEAEEKSQADAAKRPSVELHGRIQTDWAHFDQDSTNKATVGDIENGSDFRRVRLQADGDLLEWMDYRVEMDFAASGRPSFTDVYIGNHNLPFIGNARTGHFKEPFSLEELTSSRFITFMERSLPNTFSPARNWGVMAYDHTEDEVLTWAYGLFREDSNDFGEEVGDAGEKSFTTRVTWNPWYEDEGERVLHFGFGYSFRAANNDEVRYRQRPEISLSGDDGDVPRFVDTGLILTDDINLLGAEAALVYGPFSLQSELIYSLVDQIGGPDLAFPGIYVYASYFLTGERRNYNRSSGTFDRVRVHENFASIEQDGLYCCQGPGAWELAVRWSYLDLNDENIAGGRLNDLTFGLNWYLNPYSRLMFNYIHAFLDDPVTDDSDADIFAMRYQIDF